MARYASQPTLPVQPLPGAQPQGMFPPQQGIGLASAARAGAQNPNPLTAVKPQQPGLATTAGIQQLAQKAAAWALGRAISGTPTHSLTRKEKRGEVSTGAGASSAGASNSSGGGSGGGGTGVSSSGFGTNPVSAPNVPGAAPNQAQGQPGVAGGVGMPGIANNAGGLKPGLNLGSPGPGGGVGAVGPGWASLSPNPPRPVKVASWAKAAAMVGMPPPTPGLTANMPPPPGPPGMAQQAPPGLPVTPPPNGGAPVPQAGGQPSVDPSTGQPMGGQPGQPGQPQQGAPGQQPGMPQGPAAPMQEPPPAPLPMNPRLTPPRPMSPSDHGQQSLTAGLFADMHQADSPLNAAEAHDDMQDEAMAMGSKTASLFGKAAGSAWRSSAARAIGTSPGDTIKYSAAPDEVPIGEERLPGGRLQAGYSSANLPAGHVNPAAPTGSYQPRTGVVDVRSAVSRMAEQARRARGVATPSPATTRILPQAPSGGLTAKIPGGKGGLAMGGAGLVGGMAGSALMRYLAKQSADRVQLTQIETEKEAAGIGSVFDIARKAVPGARDFAGYVGKKLFGGGGAASAPKMLPPGPGGSAALVPHATANPGGYAAWQKAVGNQAMSPAGPHAGGGLMRHLGGEIAPTAMGAAGGAFGGSDTPWDTGSTVGNAALGAAAFNPRLNRMMGGRGVGALGNAPMRSIQGGILGADAGGGLDAVAGMTGLVDPQTGQPLTNFARTGGHLGAMAGAVSGAGRAVRQLAPAGGRMQDFGNRMRAVGEGALSPVTAPMAAARRAMGGGSAAAATAPPAFGRYAGQFGTGRMLGTAAGGLLGAQQVLHGTKQFFQNSALDAADNYINTKVPQVADYAQGRMQDYLHQHGLVGEDGQMNAAGALGHAAGSAVDSILHRLGMDPAAMSPLQKMMVLGGTGMGGVGALAGSPLMAGAGGAAALGGLMPHLAMLSRGAAGQGQGQPQQPWGPANSPQGQPNAPQARNEWLAQAGRMG